MLNKWIGPDRQPMSDFGLKLDTVKRLGLRSLRRYFFYSLILRTPLSPARRLKATVPQAPFFREPDRLTDKEAPDGLADRPSQHIEYFGWLRVPLSSGDLPDWNWNPVTRRQISQPKRPWWKIPDFEAESGDIRAIWELSRFGWVILAARDYRLGDGGAITRLNKWLADWLQCNPPYRGPNWKCGQEASIRLMHLALAAVLLGQDRDPSQGLCSLVRVHLKRIAPTILYAVAQNNNHGTSEAAALFIGGSWLEKSDTRPQVVKWKAIGRQWLEDRVQHLIARDGSFSQYSVNYHRLLLDTLNVVEVWRKRVGEPPFSAEYYERCALATEWLNCFTDPSSGRAPNCGANDGSRLFPIAETDHHDNRPTVQLASVLFLKKSAFCEGPWNEVLRHLDLPIPDPEPLVARSRLFDEGGYSVLVCGEARLFVRYPRFGFRPSHADALHLDLWVGGTNILRDSGSFSYAAEAPIYEYFRGVAGHNTIQFDDREQMKSLGRFLYGGWAETIEVQGPTSIAEGEAFTVAYRDWRGVEHRRRVLLESTRLCVEDEIRGFKSKAVLRWRLFPGAWLECGQHSWRFGRCSIKIRSQARVRRAEVVEGWEAPFYLRLDCLPVLEVELSEAGKVSSEISWAS